MSGIYIHIPFCKRKCYYCNFYSTTVTRDMEPLLRSIGKEARMRNAYLENSEIDTLYLGGGTPSLLNRDQLNFITGIIQTNFSLSKDAEITIEANPDDINGEFLDYALEAGINRISLGVQSFRDVDLKELGRRHNATQAIKSIDLIKKAGFSNFSIDLIYGMNALDNDSWSKNLDTFSEIDIPHLSAYALTVEPGTTLDTMILKNKAPNPDDEKISVQFNILMDKMEANGYLHYEISNFARYGWFSKHNSSYWKGVPYLGIGPSAHSFNGISRQWNIDDNKSYIHSIDAGLIPFTMEVLSISDRYNEYIMTSLRTMWGVDGAEIQKHFGETIGSQFLKCIQKHIKKNNVRRQENGAWILTNRGKLFADAIISDFFITDNLTK